MNDAARVTSVEAIQRFYSAVRVFQDEADGALLSLDQQLAKALAWFDYDIPHYWKEQVRRAFDEVARARTTYETCKMRTVAGRRPACDEERVALAAAKRRLEFCQEKVEVVGRCAVNLHRVVGEFRAQTGRFRQFVEGDVEKTAALLSRTVASLESYLGRSLQPEEAKEASPEPKEEE